MKRRILMTVILAGILISCNYNDSPDVKTPSVVLNTFQREFPEAIDIRWEEFKDNYEVEFEYKNIDYSAIIARDGNLIKYKYEILSSQLPEAVNNTIKTNYDMRKIDDYEILKIGKITYYQIEIDGSLMDEKLVFNSTGDQNSQIKYFD